MLGGLFRYLCFNATGKRHLAEEVMVVNEQIASLNDNRIALEEEEPNDTKDFAELFNIDNFVKKEFVVSMPVMAKTHSFSVFRQARKKTRLPRVTPDTIYTFIKKIFDNAHLNPGFS